MKKELIEVTPENYKCEFDASCPSIFIEVTPYNIKCQDSLVCPAIFKNEESYIIVGKIVSADEYPVLEGRIGVDEIAIKVPIDLIGTVDNK